MSEELINSEDPHDLHQSYDLPCLPYNLIIFKLLQDHGDEEWEKSNEVHKIHGFYEELPFERTTDDSGEVLNCENDNSDEVQNFNGKLTSG